MGTDPTTESRVYTDRDRATLVLRKDVGDIRFEIVRVIRRGGPRFDETIGWSVLDLVDVDLVDAKLASKISLEAVPTREEAEAEARRLAAE